MTIAKAIKISGTSIKEIDETSTLLQDFLNTVAPVDVRKLLLAFKQKPSVLKTALKFV